MDKKLIKTAICDDDIRMCSKIEKDILDYCQRVQELVNIEIYYTGESLYKDLMSGIAYDLLFLDIELEGTYNGIKIGQYIRNGLKNEVIQIIYVSSYKKYALDLFKNRPMDFLIKPITSSMIYQAVKTGIKLIGKNETFFQYKLGRNINKEYIKNVLYFQSKDREVEMVTIREKITFYGSLQDIYNQLKQNRFFYSHKSYLVNYIHVREFFYDRLLLSNDETIQIAQTRRKAVREIQKEYLMKEIIEKND